LSSLSFVAMIVVIVVVIVVIIIRRHDCRHCCCCCRHCRYLWDGMIESIHIIIVGIT